MLTNRQEEDYLDEIDFHLLHDFCSILSPFKMASEFLSSDLEPTLHLALPFIKLLNETCDVKNKDSSHIKELKKHLKEKIADKICLSEFHYMATFLHAETKSLSVR